LQSDFACNRSSTGVVVDFGQLVTAWGHHVPPTPVGAQIIADLVWKTMQDHCIAQ
jgi:hypothetical protein